MTCSCAGDGWTRLKYSRWSLKPERRGQENRYWQQRMNGMHFLSIYFVIYSNFLEAAHRSKTLFGFTTKVAVFISSLICFVFLFLFCIHISATSSSLCPHSNCLCCSGWEAASAEGETATGGGRESQGRAAKETDSAAGWGSHGQRGSGKIDSVSFNQGDVF